MGSRREHLGFSTILFERQVTLIQATAQLSGCFAFAFAQLCSVELQLLFLLLLLILVGRLGFLLASRLLHRRSARVLLLCWRSAGVFDLHRLADVGESLAIHIAEAFRSEHGARDETSEVEPREHWGGWSVNDIDLREWRLWNHRDLVLLVGFHVVC